MASGSTNPTAGSGNPTNTPSSGSGGTTGSTSAAMSNAQVSQFMQMLQNQTLTRAQIATVLQSLGNRSTPAVVGPRKLSHWAYEGLDLGDSGFSKLHAKESKYNEDTLYDLNEEKFLNVRKLCEEKVKKIFAKEVFTINDGTTDHNLITQYPSLKETEIVNSRDDRWPAQTPTYTLQEEWDKFTDKQIKASVFGSYLHSMLNADAKRKLDADKDFFCVTNDDGEYIDGPSLYYKVAKLVDPNNMHLIQSLRNKISKMSVKDFGYSAKTMLTEFKNQIIRLEELGDTYTPSDRFRDLFKMCRTVKDKQFVDYVGKKRDDYYEMTEAARSKTTLLDEFVEAFRNKETTMRFDGEWNKPSEEQKLVVALASHLISENKGKGKSNQKGDDKKKNKKQKDNDKKKFEHPEWKVTGPKEDEKQTLEKNDRTYHWCTKCRDGKGLWAMHKTDDHKDFRKKKDNQKKVTFEDKKKKKEHSDKSGKKEIKVDSDLLKTAKAYLTQFKDEDFQ